MDEIAAEFGFKDKIARCFLKSDTQGFDLHVLRGAGELLQSVKMLQLEMSVARIYEASTKMPEMLQFLEECGFAPVALFPINRFPDWSAPEFDYLGVKRDPRRS